MIKSLFTFAPLINTETPNHMHISICEVNLTRIMFVSAYELHLSLMLFIKQCVQRYQSIVYLLGFSHFIILFYFECVFKNENGSLGETSLV